MEKWEKSYVEICWIGGKEVIKKCDRLSCINESFWNCGEKLIFNEGKESMGEGSIDGFKDMDDIREICVGN